MGEQIDLHRRLLAVGGELPRVARAAAASGVQAQHIEWLRVGAQVRTKGAHGVVRGEIKCHLRHLHLRAGHGRANRGGRAARFELEARPRRQHDDEADGGEDLGREEADATRAARDERAAPTLVGVILAQARHRRLEPARLLWAAPLVRDCRLVVILLSGVQRGVHPIGCARVAQEDGRGAIRGVCVGCRHSSRWAERPVMLMSTPFLSSPRAVVAEKHACDSGPWCLATWAL